MRRLVGPRAEARGTVPDPNPGRVNRWAEHVSAVHVTSPRGRRRGVGNHLLGHAARRRGGPVEIVGGERDRRGDAAHEAIEGPLGEALRPAPTLGRVGDRREKVGVDKRKVQVAGRRQQGMGVRGEGRNPRGGATVAGRENEGVEGRTARDRW